MQDWRFRALPVIKSPRYVVANPIRESQPRTNGPHQGQSVRSAGAPLTGAKAAMVLVHGRGATAESILALADEWAGPEVACLAPQAADRTWYRQSFLAPLEDNEPGLSSGLQAIEDVLGRVAAEGGLGPDRTVLLGFSQGACLALEFAARHARPFGGIVALSGGLIGTGSRPGVKPPGDKRFDYEGDFAGTPVFLGCSDHDPHIPVGRVQESAEVFRRLGADVTERLYEGLGHTVNEDEMQFVRALLARLVRRSS